jgi:DNA primase
VGLCPFHPEKTPSFTVSPDRQLFYCFGCGAGGDVYSFLMRQEGLSFAEALRRLADRAGVRLPQGTVGRGEDPHRDLYQVNQAAQAIYHHLLVRHRWGRPGREYLKKRGLGEEDWERFGLGWAPEEDVIGPYLRRKGVSEELLVGAGLVIRRPDGRVFDRFRQRVIFPIYDRQGRVVGFGGRALQADQEPKYLNTSETPIFHKGEILYGLNWAQAEARRRGRVVVVEGYMDVLSAHRHGITYVVASLGTALTPGQARLLKGLAEQVVISFDADAAGSSATLRGLEMLRDAGLRVWVAPLPEGYDPDKLVNEKGPEELARRWNEEAVPLIAYKLSRTKQHYALATPEGRVAAAREVLSDLAAIASPLERQEEVRRVAEELGLREDALWQELKRFRRRDKMVGSRDNKTGVPEPAIPWRRRAEEDLLGAMLQDRSLCGRIVSELGWDFFTEERAGRLADALRRWYEEHPEGSPDVAALAEELRASNPEVAALALALAVREKSSSVSLEDNLRAVKAGRLEEEARDLQNRLRTADPEEAKPLLSRLAELQRALTELKSAAASARERGEKQ